MPLPANSLRQLLVSKDCFSGVLSVVKVSITAQTATLEAFLSYHLQALNIKPSRVKDGDTYMPGIASLKPSSATLPVSPEVAV